jgi:hypothetical protein
LQKNGPPPFDLQVLELFAVGIENLQRRATIADIQTDVIHASLLSLEASGLPNDLAHVNARLAS